MRACRSSGPGRGEYGLLVADAFSSDAIPTHLLTREAVRLYRRKLRPDGVLAFHISNRFLDLEPVLGEVARERAPGLPDPERAASGPARPAASGPRTGW